MLIPLKRRLSCFQARILDHLDIDTNVVTANVGFYLEKRGDLELAAVLYDRAKVDCLSRRRSTCSHPLSVRFYLENPSSVYDLQPSSFRSDSNAHLVEHAWLRERSRQRSCLRFSSLTRTE